MIISPIKSLNLNSYNNKTSETDTYEPLHSSAKLSSYPSCYYLSFGKRVDKDLKSFYLRNKDIMPSTVKSYIESLDDKELQTLSPQRAQAKAYEKIWFSTSIEEVIEQYPDEPLFADLKNPEDIKIRSGLLSDIVQIKPDLDKEGETVLNTGEDITVYLLKKALVESKTLSEINESLDSDLNPIFKREDGNYITSNQLGLLGIKLPQRAYMQSLRYTREGYSDLVGDKISSAWENLSDEDKLKRIEHILQSRGQMSPETIEQLRQKRSLIMKERWAKMSAKEKTQAIENMQTGTIYQKVAMVDAWNNCPKIRNSLSEFLVTNNFFNPSEIYRMDVFSVFMSNLMTEFWNTNPDYAKDFGEALKNSYERVDRAKENGSFAELKKSVFEKQQEIRKELKKFKLEKPKPEKNEAFEEFKKCYGKIFDFMPKDFLNDYFEYAKGAYSNNLFKLLVKKISGEKLNQTDVKIYAHESKAIKVPTGEFAKKVQAINLALAETITNAMVSKKSTPASNIAIYELDYGYLSSIASHLRKQNSATLNIADVPVKIAICKKISAGKIDELYKKYSSPLSDDDIKNLKEKLLEGVDNREDYEQKLTEILSCENKAFLKVLANDNSVKYGAERLDEFRSEYFADTQVGEQLYGKIVQEQAKKLRDIRKEKNISFDNAFDLVFTNVHKKS